MSKISIISACLLVALLGSVAVADHLPPVDPIMPGGDHSHENHDGHTHTGGGFSAEHASFRFANLGGAHLGQVTGTDFTGAVFIGGSMRGTRSSGGTLFVDADLRGIEFDDAFIYDSDFRSAKFAGANLGELTANGSDFRGATFRDPVFGDATFGLTDLWFANLSGLDLSHFDFASSNFHSSDFRGTNLQGSNFRGTSEAYILQDAIFDSTTTYDLQTRFPPGFDPVAAGLTLVPEPSSRLLLLLGALTLAYWRIRR